MTSKWLKRYRGWIALVVLAGIGASALSVYQKSKTPDATTTYQTEAASTGALAVTIAGTGNLAIRESVECWPKTSGTVLEVAVSEGETVAAGDVLYSLDPADAQSTTTKSYASYLSAKDAVQRATAAVAKARNALETVEEAYAAQGRTTSASSSGTAPATVGTIKVTKADIAEAEADVASAKTSLYSAKANRESAQQDYEDAQEAEGQLVVKAPCDGVVYSLDVAAGDSVNARSGGSSSAGTASSGGSSATSGASGATASTSSGSSAPLALIEEGALCVQLTVNEVDLPSLKLGQRADITIDAFEDMSLTGKVIEVANAGTVSSGVVTFDVWLSIDVPEDGLREGMTAAGTIVAQVVEDALMVPNSGVETDDQGDYVMVMRSGDTEPVRTSVTTGLSNASNTQILSGLSEGNLVVTSSSSTGSDSSSSATEGQARGGMMGGIMGGGRPGGGF